MDHDSQLLENVVTLDYVKLAIPLFFILVVVEVLTSWNKGLKLYRVNDSFNSISCGIIHQLFCVMVKFFFTMPYIWIYNHYALFNVTQLSFWPKLFSWFALVILLDFFYYWYHRSAHRMNIGWATHVVHHSSEEYNLTTSLRQGVFQDAFSFSFFLPLALIGYPPAWYVSMYSINLVYQFFIHTQLIKKTPNWCEAIFNTPSHHRVHHGQNSQYIDRNHGGIFIVWDRLFGTFEPEVEEPVYGITTQLKSWNPIWAQLHHFSLLISETRLATHWSDKIKVWIKDPGWRPRGLTPYQAKNVNKRTFSRFDPPIKKASLYKALGFFMGGMIISNALLYVAKPFSFIYTVFSFVTVLLLVKVGTLFEEQNA